MSACYGGFPQRCSAFFARDPVCVGRVCGLSHSLAYTNKIHGNIQFNARFWALKNSDEQVLDWDGLPIARGPSKVISGSSQGSS